MHSAVVGYWAHLVPREVLQEFARYHHLRTRLRVVLGRHALDQPREVVLHLQGRQGKT